MWDEALDAARISGRPVLVFDVDLVDTMSIAFRDSTLKRKDVQAYLSEQFELAVNDFSVDPEPSVGFDSLRHLGLRLSGLEERYRIVVRPTAIVIRPDGSEIDRISFPNRLTPTQFLARVEEIRQERNIIQDYIDNFWRDTTSEVARLDLIERFESRSEYDSVVYHLDVVRQTSAMPHMRRTATLRHAYLRFQVEGNTIPLRRMMAQLTRSPEDSLIYLEALTNLLQSYQARKMPDSVIAFYDRIIAFTGARTADILNEYAWDLANFARRLDTALALVNEAITLRGDDENFYDTRALVHVLMKNYPMAVEDAKRALELAEPEERPYFEERVKLYQQRLDEVTAEEAKKQPPKKAKRRKR